MLLLGLFGDAGPVCTLEFLASRFRAGDQAVAIAKQTACDALGTMTTRNWSGNNTRI